MKVSVVIPVKDGEKTIKRVLDAVLKQDYKNFEIIVVDDGSNDSTIKIVNSYGNKIKLLRNKKNLGPAASRNRGYKEAKGDFIFFTDSDCEVPKNWISSLLAEYKNKSIAGVGGFLQPGKNNIISKMEKFQNKFLLGISDKKIVNGAKTPCGYTHNMSYRKEILNNIGGFNENFKFPAGEDVELKKRVCEQGYNVVYLPLSVKHLEGYDLNYLLKRIIARGLDIKPKKSDYINLAIVFFSFPIICFNILKKFMQYKIKKLL